MDRQRFLSKAKRPLPSLEFCGTLFEERRHAFAEILGAKQRQQLQEDVVDVIAEILGKPSAHHPMFL